MVQFYVGMHVVCAHIHVDICTCVGGLYTHIHIHM